MLFPFSHFMKVNPQDTFSLSVIVPVYNGANFVLDIMKFLQSECPTGAEIIVVDDGSTDNTADLIRSCTSIHSISQENLGPSAARNMGLKVAKNEFVAFLDVDDIWPVDSLKQRLNYLLQNQHLDIVLGHLCCFRVLNTGEKELSEPFVSFNLGAALYRRTVFEKVGLFDEALRYGEDTDWFLRAREIGATISVIDTVTLHYRLHDSGMTHGKNATDLNVVRVLKRSLDRRRAAQPAETTSGPPSQLSALPRENG